jgi:flagellar hook-associated protein 3 FlgL
MQKIQEQLATGRAVNRPSDSPVKTVEALQFRANIKRTEQYVGNAEDGLARLGAADAALSNGLDMTRRAKVLLLQGMDDTNNAQGRAALAAEVRALRDGLVGVANSRYLDRPLFAGNTLTQDAFDKSTGQYVGEVRLPSDPATVGQVLRSVGPGTDVPVNLLGTDVFGDDGTPDQLFAVLDEIAAALGVGDPAARHARLDGGLVDLDRAVDRVISALGEIGARANRLTAVKSSAEADLDSLTNSLSEVESADLPKTIVELQMQEVAYKAALGATARVIQPSLLDFLR